MIEVMDSVAVEVPIKRCVHRKARCARAVAGWWIVMGRRSSTRSSRPYDGHAQAAH